MKLFTKLIVALGIIMMFLYGFGSIETFVVAPGSIVDYDQQKMKKLLDDFHSLSPEQKIQLKERVADLKRQLGMPTEYSVNGPDTALPSSNIPADMASSSAGSSSGSSAGSAAGYEVQFRIIMMLRELGLTPPTDPTKQSQVTHSDLQALIQAIVKKEIASQGLTSNLESAKAYDNNYRGGAIGLTPEASCKKTTTPVVADRNLEELRRAAIRKAMMMNARKKKETKYQFSNCPVHKEEPCSCGQGQVVQTAKEAACPPPDPATWIKRNEIPCWGCKV
jgi:hypothetical protein